jgi:hypothetical protein
MRAGLVSSDPMGLADGTLFNEAELCQWLEQRRNECGVELAQVPESQVLERPLTELSESLVSRYRVAPVELQMEQQYGVDLGEREIWGSGGLVASRVRLHTGRGVPGRAVAIHVPFTGDPSLLRLRPSTGTSVSPRALVEKSELVFTFEWSTDTPFDIEAALAASLKAISAPYLEAQAKEITSFNEELSAFVHQALGNRKKGILEARQHLDGLRIPVHRRDDAPKTYAAPGVERRSVPHTPAGKSVAPLEPTLVDDFYRHIIEVISRMARGMERNPGDYASWTEEKLRDALLVMLNTHYQGQATGETFNKSGKTDILVRVEDRNVFVDECKFWSGPTGFAGTGQEKPSALDQLLSYATWRDAKLALTIFVGSKDIGKTIASAHDALAAHPAFVTWTKPDDEGQLRCRVRLPDDESREADLAVIFVHLLSD